MDLNHLIESWNGIMKWNRGIELKDLIVWIMISYIGGRGRRG